jgi:predicted nucleic acid-binding protein
VILVDTSVWISHFRRENSPAAIRLRELGQHTPLLVGDYILLEVLQGARDDAHAARLEREMRRIEVVPLLSPGTAVRAASNYRRLRGLGITIRKTADITIGTFCIDHRCALSHADRDFEAMRRYLGLQVVAC